MKENINSKIESFIKSIEGAEPLKAMNIAKNEVSYLLSLYSKATVRAYLTKYKKAVKPYNKQVLKHLKLRAKEQNQIEKDYNVKLKEQHRKLHRIKDSSKVIDTAIHLLGSDSANEISIGLCLLTGRRIGEILKTAKFTNSKKSQKVMYFMGQLKTKRVKFKYEIYVLGDSRDLCKSSLKKLRSMLDTKNMSQEQINAKYNVSINKKTNAIFGKYLGECTSHKLRAAYAAICLHKFHNKIDLSERFDKTENDLLSDILGHEMDIKTAESYRKFSVLK